MVVFLVSLQCGLNKIGNHSKRASLGLSLTCYWTFFLLKDFNSCGRNSKTELRLLRGNWLVWRWAGGGGPGGWGWVVSSIWYLSKAEEYKRGNSWFTAGRTRDLLLRFSFGKVAVLKKCRVLGQFCDSVFILWSQITLDTHGYYVC